MGGAGDSRQAGKDTRECARAAGGVGKAAKPVAEKEYAQILAFAQKQLPDLKTIPAYSAGYWMELYQREAYGFDSQAVRAYFQFAEVQRGVLETMERLFHVSCERSKDWSFGMTR